MTIASMPNNVFGVSRAPQAKRGRAEMPMTSSETAIKRQRRNLQFIRLPQFLSSCDESSPLRFAIDSHNTIAAQQRRKAAVALRPKSQRQTRSPQSFREEKYYTVHQEKTAEDANALRSSDPPAAPRRGLSGRPDCNSDSTWSAVLRTQKLRKIIRLSANSFALPRAAALPNGTRGYGAKLRGARTRVS